MTGWRHVEGVEVNPQIVSLVRQYGDYNGHIFNREGVDIHIGDGRHYLERSEHQYDLIALPLVYAEAADLVGYALLENYLFTREAFQAYIDHLQPEGRLALVVHNHALMTRALATLADGWTDRPGGTGSVLDHVLVVNGTRANRSQAEAQRPLVLVQKAPYTDAQIRQLRAVIDELDLQLYYAPRFLEHPRLRSLRSGSVEDFVGAQTGDISPVSDARPFLRCEQGARREAACRLVVRCNRLSVRADRARGVCAVPRSVCGGDPIRSRLLCDAPGRWLYDDGNVSIAASGSFPGLSDPNAGCSALWSAHGSGARQSNERAVGHGAFAARAGPIHRVNGHTVCALQQSFGWAD